MIVLDTSTPILHETVSLFSNWEFWAFICSTMAGLLTVYFKQSLAVNTLRVQMDMLKEQIERDRQGVHINHKKLYDLCTDINQRLSNMEGAIQNSKK